MVILEPNTHYRIRVSQHGKIVFLDFIIQNIITEGYGERETSIFYYSLNTVQWLVVHYTAMSYCVITQMSAETCLITRSIQERM